MIHRAAAEGFGSAAADYESARPGYPADALFWKPYQAAERLPGRAALCRQVIVEAGILNDDRPEAASERQTGKTFPPPAVSAVKSALEPADEAREASRENAGRLTVTKRDSGSVLLFEARDRDQGGEWIHKSYVVK